MNDYFDQLEQVLKEAVARRAHLRWYARVPALVRPRGVAILIAALVVATPTVAAVGAASGWFSRGTPDLYYPPSPLSGLGKVLPKGDRLLPGRVADPDGGPPWGVRLVSTNRGDTCIQVGRVEDGQIGALGIDGAWKNDHLFHEIKPNDGLADICGATDGAGHGFANQGAYGAPASVDVPLFNSSGGSRDRCRSPYSTLSPAILGGTGQKPPPAIAKRMKRIAALWARSPLCPARSMRLIFAGLLGPDAESITYKTPGGQTRTESTFGGVGAYLVVFRETSSNCSDFTKTALSSSIGCQSAGTGNGVGLSEPTPITSVTYTDGRSCSTEPSQRLLADYRKFNVRSRKQKSQTGNQIRAAFEKFLADHGLTKRGWFNAIQPVCQPVGWVPAKQAKLTAAQVRSPLSVSVVEANKFCYNGPPGQAYKGKTIACEHGVPHGYRRFFEYPPRSPQTAVLVTVSFTARQPVTTTSSFYWLFIKKPGNHGGGNDGTEENVRRGQRITFTMFESLPGNGPEAVAGVYHATINFVPNSNKPNLYDGYNPLLGGSLIVGTFSFRLPLKH